MKKIFAIIVSLILIMSMAACGGDEPKENPAENPSADNGETENGNNEAAGTPEIQEEPEKTEVSLAKGVWSDKSGEYTMNIVATETFVDEEGDNSLRIYYDFTNGSIYSTSPTDTMEFNITQNGGELDEAYVSYKNAHPLYGMEMMNIRSGLTLRCIWEVKANPENGPVNIKVEAYRVDEPVIDFEVDLADVTGIPEEERPIEPVSDPQWVKGWPVSGIYAKDFEISIDKYDFTENSGGKKLIRVYLTFKNNSDEEERANYTVEARAFQDGVQLMPDTASPLSDEEDAIYDYIQPGESIIVAYSFVIRSDSPIEIEIYDPWTDSGAGMGMIVEVQ